MRYDARRYEDTRRYEEGCRRHSRPPLADCRHPFTHRKGYDRIG